MYDTTARRARRAARLLQLRGEAHPAGWRSIVYAVELEPEESPEAQRWTRWRGPAIPGATAGDPLGLLFRVVILRGARRAEACGFRWAGADLDAGYLSG